MVGDPHGRFDFQITLLHHHHPPTFSRPSTPQCHLLRRKGFVLQPSQGFVLANESSAAAARPPLQVPQAFQNSSSRLRKPYNGLDVESRVKAFWADSKVVAKARAQAQAQSKPYFFLDGPPYTSGQVHLGTAWNKVLKDVFVRTKRMQGYNVWDRPGFDMHGLPTEKATEKKLGLKSRDEVEALGVDKFVDECRQFCLTNMETMSQTFKELGVWMDFDNPCCSVTKDFLDGEWWLVKKMHERGRLYEGEKTLTWDAVNGTALAKHELYYETVTSTAAFVSLAVTGRDPQAGQLNPALSGAHLVVWTTTPWTLPFNLAVMVNPNMTYCVVSASLQGKTLLFVVAEARLPHVLEEKLGVAYRVVGSLPGRDLAGVQYTHPFRALAPSKYDELKRQMPNLHSVVLDAEVVTATLGTGAVHCAPGCGAEDYVVGLRNGLKAFNTVNGVGVFENFPPFNGLRARKDDAKFVELLKEHGALLLSHPFEHEYPFGERSKEPVIFKTTKQWFFKVEDLKPLLLAENSKVQWVPKSAGVQFEHWLENLRDNSVSKQRFWGTPLPVWRNVDDPSDYFVIGSVQELCDLAGVNASDLADFHGPTVDKLPVYRVSPLDGKVHQYKRVPDVLDVWVDAGCAPWNSLGYPFKMIKEQFDTWFPMPFVLEGKDQIRGWFNLLHVLSVALFDHRAFNACYMHGFVNDASGEKMSKSLGNIVQPHVVTNAKGTDVLRYYLCGGAAPGLDLNFSLPDVEVRLKELNIFWNVLRYLVDTAENLDLAPVELSQVKDTGLGTEEKYLLSCLQTLTSEMTARVESFQLNDLPALVQNFLVETVSHTYLQLVWEKVASGSDAEKLGVLSVLFHCFLTVATLVAPLMPYLAEEMYQALREPFPGLVASQCPEESVHLRSWPVVDPLWHQPTLEADVALAKDVLTSVLAARDKVLLGVKWPLELVFVNLKNSADSERLLRCETLVRNRTNVRRVVLGAPALNASLRLHHAKLGKQFGRKKAIVQAAMEANLPKLVALVDDPAKHGQSLPLTVADGTEVLVSEDLFALSRDTPPQFQEVTGQFAQVFVDKTRTTELDQEGYLREIVRRVQLLRKQMGLRKLDRLRLVVVVDGELVHKAVMEGLAFVYERAGVVASEVFLAPSPAAHDALKPFSKNDTLVEKVKVFTVAVAGAKV